MTLTNPTVLSRLATEARDAEEGYRLAMEKAWSRLPDQAGVIDAYVKSLLSDLARARAEADAYRRGWQYDGTGKRWWYHTLTRKDNPVVVAEADLVSHLASLDTTEKPDNG